MTSVASEHNFLHQFQPKGQNLCPGYAKQLESPLREVVPRSISSSQHCFKLFYCLLLRQA